MLEDSQDLWLTTRDNKTEDMQQEAIETGTPPLRRWVGPEIY